MKLLLKVGYLALTKFTDQTILGQLTLTRLVFNPFLASTQDLHPLTPL